MNPRISRIIESLHVNEAVSERLLDRFIKYCQASNVKNIGYIKERDRYYIYGISDKRFKALASSFAKTNKLIFEYDLDGTTRILRLETKIGGRDE